MLPSTGNGATYWYLNAFDIANLVAINVTDRSDSKTHHAQTRFCRQLDKFLLLLHRIFLLHLYLDGEIVSVFRSDL